MLRFTAFVSFPLMLGLAFIARELIVVCVTEKWLASVPMMQILCVWGAFVPVQGLFSNLVISSGKSYIYMWNTIILCLLQIVVLASMAPYGIENMIVAFVAVNMLAWGMVSVCPQAARFAFSRPAERCASFCPHRRSNDGDDLLYNTGNSEYLPVVGRKGGNSCRYIYGDDVGVPGQGVA